jgi:hypothetical protein
LMHRRHLSFQSSYFTVLSRFWISLYLGVLLFSLLNLLRRIFLQIKFRHTPPVDNQRLNFLILISLAAQFQIWPFFDGMHFWWGSVPGVVVVVLIFKNILTFSWARVQMRILIAVGVLTMSLIPWGVQSQIQKNALVLNGTKAITINALDAKVNNQTSKFLQQNLRINSVVLNLCQNPDVFLTHLEIVSATRYFVFWPHMMHLNEIRDSFENSKPDTIVTCTLDEFNTDTQAQSEIQQRELLEKVAPNRTLRAQATLGKIWEIWNVN